MISSRFSRDMVCLILLPLTLSSCGDIKGLLKQRSDKSDKAPLARELEATALELQNSKYIEPCDERLGALRIEVSRELDRRINEIEQLMFQAEEPSADYKGVAVGPLILSEQIVKPESVDKWQSVTASWQKVEELWDQYKGTQTDENWVRLNSYVRSLLTDDKSRILYGSNYYLVRGDYSALSKLKSEVDACNADESCVEPKLSAEAEELARRNYYYSYYVESLSSNVGLSSGSDENPRELIASWKKFIDFDLSDVSFRGQDHAVSADKKTLEVKLNPGPLGGYEDILANYIESAWSSKDFTVDIKWVDEGDVFSIVVDEDIGGRAFVRHSDKTMHISNGVTDKTLVHEFGHVMGLPDEYYTTWNRDTCVYSYEYNDSNIMSDSYAGTVIAAHIKALKTNYGMK